MTILADENIEKPIVEMLRGKGYKVFYVAELDPSIPDNEVLARANEQNALLLTGDKDFGELVYRQRLVSNGVCLIRLSGLSTNLKKDIVSAAFEEHGEELQKAFSVISPHSLRIRKE